MTQLSIGCELPHCKPCQGKITLRTKQMPTEATSESFRNVIRGEALSPEFCPRDKILGDTSEKRHYEVMEI